MATANLLELQQREEKIITQRKHDFVMTQQDRKVSVVDGEEKGEKLEIENQSHVEAKQRKY